MLFRSSGVKRVTLGITDDIRISARPAEAEDRAVPGHWEGDLLLGGVGKGAVLTLVERSSRFVLLAPLPGQHRADQARWTLNEMIATLPLELRKSITWDRGIEMAQHARFTIESGIPIYFCDPRSPWQRGTNENTNGLLRQYWPKGSDLRRLTMAECDRVALNLNTRPRKTLEWQTETPVPLENTTANHERPSPFHLGCREAAGPVLHGRRLPRCRKDHCRGGPCGAVGAGWPTGGVDHQ
mgnify:CR=1 FL=1